MRRINKENGITLIALIITIIVLFILAGVSISTVVGPNGILNKAQDATYAQKIAKYLEEYELNSVDTINNKGESQRKKITLLNEFVKQLIPSLEDKDIGEFAIINGDLYYTGSEAQEENICKNQGMKTLPEGATVESFEEEVETKAIEALMKELADGAFTTTDEDGNVVELGVKLYDKNLSNGEKWKIITEVEDNKTIATYGTDWYYVESGTDIEGIGPLKNSYIINYDEQKAVKFNSNKHMMLAYGSNLAVRDSLALNMDPINMDNNGNWGEGVTLYGVTEGDGYGWNGTQFDLDGVDDYIEIYSDIELDKGITLEYYAKSENNWQSMLCKTVREDDGNYSKRFRAKFLTNKLQLCAGAGKCLSDWAERGDPNYHWIQSPELGSFNNENGGYVSMTIDFVTDTIKVYWNGEFKGETVCSHDWLMGGGLTNGSIPFTIGLEVGGNQYSENFSKASIYACRLYTRVLDSTEIIANYNATVSYHNILVNGGDASTGGEALGETN